MWISLSGIFPLYDRRDAARTSNSHDYKIHIYKYVFTDSRPGRMHAIRNIIEKNAFDMMQYLRY